MPSAAAPAEELAGNCPSFVGLKNGQAKSKFNKAFMTDDEYCEKNCRAGFCPETRLGLGSGSGSGLGLGLGLELPCGLLPRDRAEARH